MADPDRLQTLRAQRDAIARHLAWLDREIADATAAAAFAPTPETPPPPVPTAPAPAPAPVAPPPRADPASPADVDEMLDELLREQEAEDPPLSKSGCWLIFAAIMLVGTALGLVLIYTIWG